MDGQLTNYQIKEALEDLDNDEDIDVTTEEANLIESICFVVTGPLSGPQRAWAMDIIEKYA